MIDAEKLEKAIDAMSIVCEKGRKEIKELFAQGLGVEFKDHDYVVLGDRVEIEGCEYVVASAGFKDGGSHYLLVNIQTGCRRGESVSAPDSSRIQMRDFTSQDWKKL